MLGEIYQQLKWSIEEAAKEDLGCQEIKRKTQDSEWWSDELRQLVGEKKKAMVKKPFIQNNMEIWNRKCEDIDRSTGGTRVVEACKGINNLRSNENNRNRIN